MTDMPVDAHSVHHGACHCGAVRFKVGLIDGLRTARRCNCSYCRMRGAVVVFAHAQRLEVEQGEDALTTYRFHTGRAAHTFCRHCGIHPFHGRRSTPDQVAINVACLDGSSPFDVADVPVFEGRDHPGDRAGGTPRLAGRLRYTPEPGEPTPPHLTS